MKSSISLFCLNLEFGRKVAKLLSEQLNMMLFDVVDCVVFDDLPRKLSETLNMFGTKQVQKHECSATKYGASFENTLVVCDGRTAESCKTIKRLKEQTYIVFVKIGKLSVQKMNENQKFESNIEKRFFSASEKQIENRSKRLSKYADFEILASRKNEFKVSAEIIRKIKEKFEKN